jgi:hypothetical protein
MAARSHSGSSWLSRLVAPVSGDDFLSRYWRQQHLLCHGAADRFAGLLSWPGLNAILEHHWREPHRFRVVRGGRDLDPASFADLGGSVPRIRARDLTDHLRRGATLSFAGVDEVQEPLRRLADAFERQFLGDTQINIYAGWHATHGLDLHRDDEDVFVLQVDGPKRWLLYGSSADGLDLTGLRRRSEPPAGAALDEILGPGDLLYVPEGVYHVAVPMNAPTLHLTVGVRKAGAGFRSRPSFSLPWSATQELLPPGLNFAIWLRVPVAPPADDRAGAASFRVRCGGHTFRFPRSMQLVVERLNGDPTVTMDALVEALAPQLDEAMVRLLVGMLVEESLVSVST